MTVKELQEQLAEANAAIQELLAQPQSQMRDSDISYWRGRVHDLERGIEIAQRGLPIPESLRYFFRHGGQRRLPVNQAAVRRY